MLPLSALLSLSATVSTVIFHPSIRCPQTLPPVPVISPSPLTHTTCSQFPQLLKPHLYLPCTCLPSWVIVKILHVNNNCHDLPDEFGFILQFDERFSCRGEKLSDETVSSCREDVVVLILLLHLRKGVQLEGHICKMHLHFVTQSNKRQFFQSHNHKNCVKILSHSRDLSVSSQPFFLSAHSV